MAANVSRLDDQVVRQLCRQMKDMTQVCEGLALKLLEIEARLEQMDSSLQGVAVAIESDGLHELLDAVGGRLGDLKGLLGMEVESVVELHPEGSSGEDSAIGQMAEEMEVNSAFEAEDVDSLDVDEDGGELETVYVDDPQIDLLSA